jgi:DNA-binding CsgD family transcriptional regulator
MNCASEVLKDEDWLALADRFSVAAVQGSGWETALSGLAAACGARAGQLLGLGADARVAFHWMAGTGPATLQDFVAVGGGDPRINPRVRAALASPVLQLVADEDCTVGEDMSGWKRYVDYCRRHDIPYVCQTNLLKPEGMVIVLAVLRSAQQGHVTPEARAAFMSIAPHVRAAVQTQVILESQGATLLSGALEALSLAAFVCDRAGKVQALTPAAEKVLGNGQGLQLRQGTLSAALPADTQTLTQTIQHAAAGVVRPGHPLLQTVVIRSGGGRAPLPLVLDVITLPRREYEFNFNPRLLVVVRGGRKAAAATSFMLHAAFGLTAAEAEVALLLAEGQTVETIAVRRCVSESTVRSQVKSLFAKLGVNRQIELAARLSELR